ncbi:MAG: gephyrin-like molybdotransferase Glp [bacterium]
MILFEEAVELVGKHSRNGGAEAVGIQDAYGRILAEDIFSALDIPAFDNSAMDGYAVSASDTLKASREVPVCLDLAAEEASAGLSRQTLPSRGAAMVIMTGGTIPHGADAVVQLEHVKTEEKKIIITKPVPRGMHIRKRGEDIPEGSLVLNKGAYLNPGGLARLAAVGKSGLLVGKRPQVAILATGNELIEPGQPNPGTGVFSSNSSLLSAKALQAGGVPFNLGIAGDDTSALKLKIEKGLEESDLLITTGGISVGKYDLVKKVLLELGVEEIFHKVRIKPGKPVFFGKYRERLVFGLPGNPAAASVTFDLLVSPAIDKFQGRDPGRLQKRTAVLRENLGKKPGRRHFLRGKISYEQEKTVVETCGNQGSGNVSSLAGADCLIVLPEESSGQKAGSLVTVYTVL